MSRLFKVVLICVALAGVLGLAVGGPWSKAAFWWRIAELPMRAFTGSAMKCQKIEWCDGLNLCLNRCTSPRLTFGEASFYPISGKLKMRDWAYSPAHRTQSIEFPRPHSILREIELTKGEVLDYRIDKINLWRTNPTSHDWKTEFSLAEKSLQGKGQIGLTKTNLNVILNRFPLKSRLLGGQLKAHLKITNDGFLSKPLEVIVKHGKIQNLRIYASELGEAALSGKIVLNPGLTSIRSIHDIQASAAGIQVHSAESPNELIAESVDLTRLKPYFRYLPKGDFELRSLSGRAKVSLSPKFQNFRQSTFWANVDALQISFVLAKNNFRNIPAKSVRLKYQPLGYLEIHADIAPTKLAKIQEPLTRAGLIIESGQFFGKFSFLRPQLAAKPEILIDYQVKDGVVKINELDQKVYAVHGKGQIHNEHNQSRLDMIYLGKPIKTKALFSFEAGSTGLLSISAPQLRLENYRIPALKLTVTGLLNDFKIDSRIQYYGLTPLDMHFQIKELLAHYSKISAFEVRGGSVKLINAKDFDLSELELYLGKQQHLKLNSSFTAGTKSVIKSVQVEGKFNLGELFDQIKLSGFQIPPELSKLGGDIDTSLSYHQGIIDLLNVDLHEVAIGYKDHSFAHASGSAHYDQQSGIRLDHLYTQYGENSNLMFTGDLSPDLLNSSPNKVFEGQLKGSLNLQDFDKSKFLQQFNLGIDPDTNFPFQVDIRSAGQVTNMNLHLEKKSPFLSEANTLPEKADAKVFFDAAKNFIKLEQLHTDFRGFHLSAKGEGQPTDFNLQAFTDPFIDLGQLGDKRLAGILRGSFQAEGLSVVDEETFWNNSQLKIESPELMKVMDLSFQGLKLDFASKQGKGVGHLSTNKGSYLDLPFEAFNTEFLLQDNYLEMPSLFFKVADGNFKMSGEFDLATQIGLFAAKADEVELGEIARGLFQENGLAGRGDFDFLVDGYLWSLLRSEKPISVSGGFSLRNGRVSSVTDLQSKLNLANLVFGGPFGLNINAFLEVFFPIKDSFFENLDGRWSLNENFATVSEAYFRGKNDLDLNMAGILERESGYGEFQFFGSYPRISKRVNRNGQISEVWNVLSYLNLSTPLKLIGLLKKHPRYFTFMMKGSNPDQMNAYATQTFHWIERDLKGALPIPELDDLDISKKLSSPKKNHQVDSLPANSSP